MTDHKFSYVCTYFTRFDGIFSIDGKPRLLEQILFIPLAYHQIVNSASHTQSLFFTCVYVSLESFSR
jgi:hypothetical protein